MIEVRKIQAQNELDPFVEQEAHTQFVQSWFWGEVLKADGKKIDRIALIQEEKLVAVATMYIIEVPFGEYMYIPRGPIWFVPQSIEAWDALATYIAETYPKLIFIRTEREIEDEALKNQKVRASVANQPRDEWIVELDKTEEELMADMKQKTRYNIRLSQRKGVEVRPLNTKELPSALALLEETAKRQKIVFHSRKHFEEIGKMPFSTWLGAFYEDQLIVAHQLIFFGDTVTYAHGGSSRDHQKVMAPHFLNWREIQLAKKEGYKFFNFGSIAPNNSDTHSLANVTRYKKGFGGRALHFPEAHDIILRSRMYSYFTMGKRIRRSALLNRILP